MRIESTQKQEATVEEVLDAMRAADLAEVVHFHFNGKTILMSGREWNEMLDSARRGQRLRAAA